MRIINNRFFGSLIGLLVGLTLTFLSAIFKTNFIYIKPLGLLPLYLGLIPILGIIGLSITRKLKVKSLNYTYFVIIIFTFIYIFSKLQWSVACCPSEYDSMYDWNATKGISFMFDLPLTLIITMIIGLLFDFIKKINYK